MSLQAETVRQTQKGKRIVPWLIAAIVFVLSGILWQMRHDPWVQLRLETWRVQRRAAARARQMEENTRFDLHLGKPVPLWDDIPKEVRGHTRTVILFLGDCVPCNIRQFQEWSRLRQAGTAEVVVFVRQFGASWQKEWKAAQLDLPVQEDPMERWKQAYNAFFVPRAFLVDQQGRLLWIQPPGMALSDAFRFVVKSVDKGQVRTDEARYDAH